MFQGGDDNEAALTAVLAAVNTAKVDTERGERVRKLGDGGGVRLCDQRPLVRSTACLCCCLHAASHHATCQVLAWANKAHNHFVPLVPIESLEYPVFPSRPPKDFEEKLASGVGLRDPFCETRFVDTLCVVKEGPRCVWRKECVVPPAFCMGVYTHLHRHAQAESMRSRHSGAPGGGVADTMALLEALVGLGGAAETAPARPDEEAATARLDEEAASMLQLLTAAGLLMGRTGQATQDERSLLSQLAGGMGGVGQATGNASGVGAARGARDGGTDSDGAGAGAGAGVGAGVAAGAGVGVGVGAGAGAGVGAGAGTHGHGGRVAADADADASITKDSTITGAAAKGGDTAE